MSSSDRVTMIKARRSVIRSTLITLAIVLLLVAVPTPSQAWITPDTAPFKSLSFPAPPRGIAFDSAGNMYVAVETGVGVSRIEVYAPGWVSGASPIRVIQGAATGLNSPYGLAIDAAGYLYAANNDPAANTITVYAPGAADNAAPSRTITSTGPALNSPSGLVLDTRGNVIVVNGGDGLILGFPTGSNGATAPSISFDPTGTTQGGVNGLAIDSADTLFVPWGDFGGGYVSSWAASAQNGSNPPTSTLTNSNIVLATAFNVGFDSAGLEYVVNSSNFVDVYSHGASGNATPLRSLKGASTGLSIPGWIAFDSAGNMYISNTGIPYTVTVYAAGGTDQSIAFPAVPETPVTSGPVAVHATASSGLPVIYTSTTPDVCTISGTSVTLLTAGTCSIVATQAGDATYNPVAATMSFTVTAVTPDPPTPISPDPLVPLIPQVPVGDCVPTSALSGRNLQLRGDIIFGPTVTTTLMKAECSTSAGVPVRVRVTKVGTGAVKLFCKLKHSVTTVKRAAGGFRCSAGALQARSRRGQMIRATWSAPAPANYAPYSESLTFRTRSSSR